MPEWTDELRKDVVERYLAEKPTPDTSIDIVKSIADDLDATPNGVRSILIKAGEYIKKGNTSSKEESSTGGTKRVNKAEAQAQLSELIESLGKEADADILSKLTGKAAVYLYETFKQED
jgi:transposase-like protein